MDTIEVEVDISQKVTVDVHPADVIQAINHRPIKYRWNTVALLLNEIECDVDQLKDDHKELIEKFLLRKLELFKPHTTGKQL